MPTESLQVEVRRHDIAMSVQSIVEPLAVATDAACELADESTDARQFIAEVQNLSNADLTREVMRLNRR